MRDDGISFSYKPVLFDEISSNFTIGAGEKLSKTKDLPSIDWVCWQFRPIGNNQFCISLDRIYSNMTSFLGVFQNGNDSIRSMF